MSGHALRRAEPTRNDSAQFLLLGQGGHIDTVVMPRKRKMAWRGLIAGRALLALSVNSIKADVKCVAEASVGGYCILIDQLDMLAMRSSTSPIVEETQYDKIENSKNHPDDKMLVTACSTNLRPRQFAPKMFDQ